MTDRTGVINTLLALLNDDGKEELLALLNEQLGVKPSAPTLEGHFPAIITDTTRGVAFGYVPDNWSLVLKETGSLPVRNMRNCFYWGGTTGGIGSLAVTGPGPNARIGATVVEANVVNVSKVLRCSEAAERAFAEAGWSK